MTCPRCKAFASECRCKSKPPTPIERRLSAASQMGRAREDATERERVAARRAEGRRIIAARAEREGTPIFGALILILRAMEPAEREPAETVRQLGERLAELTGPERARVLRLALRARLDGRGGEGWRAALVAGAYTTGVDLRSLGAKAPCADDMARAALDALRVGLRAPGWVLGLAPTEVRGA